MEAEQNKILTKLAKTHVLLAISFGVLFISFFISNFVLAFLQEVLKAVRQFANGNMEPSFDLSWGNFFHFQAALYPFYIGFYCIVVYGLIRFWINIKVNFSELNRGQLGTSEFEDEKNLRKQYKVIPGSKKDYKGGSGVIVSAIQGKNGKYELLLDTGPVHTMVLGISRSGKGERYVFPMLDVITRAEEKDSMIVNDPKGELAAASYATLKKEDMRFTSLI